MIIRVLGVLVGIAFAYVAPFMISDISGFRGLIQFIASCIVVLAFVLYGIGGQKLLKKVLPYWAQNDDT